ncbi:MAG: bifunctional nuclease family protein [Pirellulales bacterium]
MGHFEARAVASAWLRRPRPRPLTHTATASIIKALKGTLSSVVIDDIVDDVYHAVLHISAGAGAETDVDVRPSDAIALALECDAPIYVSRHVLRKQRERFGEFY